MVQLIQVIMENKDWVLGSLWLLSEALSNIPNGPNSPMHGLISGVLSGLNWLIGLAGKGNKEAPKP